MDEQARSVYNRSSMGAQLPWGDRPAVLVVDFINGFTDPRCGVGSDLTAEVEATRVLLNAAREVDVPIIFTTIAYAADLNDLGLWQIKVPGLKELVTGSSEVAVDSRLAPGPEDPLVTKKGASAFFGTDLDAMLRARGIDTVILCGASTSGCIRATAVDLMQYGYSGLVPRECVGDRAKTPHDANLFDIDAKYADVITLSAATEYLGVHAAVEVSRS